ncbi:MAG: type IV conjugative transfer system protein TraL [Deferribacterales bacterium]
MRSYVPQYLHKPVKIMMLDSDEFVILANGVLIGVLLKSIVLFISVLAVFFIYRKGKEKHPRGYFRHIPHMLGLKQFRHFPNIFIRSFKE